MIACEALQRAPEAPPSARADIPVAGKERNLVNRLRELRPELGEDFLRGKNRIAIDAQLECLRKSRVHLINGVAFNRLRLGLDDGAIHLSLRPQRSGRRRNHLTGRGITLEAMLHRDRFITLLA